MLNENSYRLSADFSSGLVNIFYTDANGKQWGVQQSMVEFVREFKSYTEFPLVNFVMPKVPAYVTSKFLYQDEPHVILVSQFKPLQYPLKDAEANMHLTSFMPWTNMVYLIKPNAKMIVSSAMFFSYTQVFDETSHRLYVPNVSSDILERGPLNEILDIPEPLMYANYPSGYPNTDYFESVQRHCRDSFAKHHKLDYQDFVFSEMVDKDSKVHELFAPHMSEMSISLGLIDEFAIKHHENPIEFLDYVKSKFNELQKEAEA